MPQDEEQSDAMTADETPANRTSDAEQLARARVLVNAANERQAEDLLALDMRGLTSLADTFLIATGSSDRQVRAIADAIEDAGRAAGMRPLGIEGLEEARWVLLDFGDAIFHVFRHDARGHYDLERLWADAPRLDIEPVEVAKRGAQR